MYRVIYRGGTYTDTAAVPAMTEDVWAVIHHELLDGGDAYQAVKRFITDYVPAKWDAR